MHGTPDLPRRMLTEFLGTFMLMAFGCSAVAVNERMDGIVGGHIGIAVSYGLIVAMIVFAIGHLSGAHINPAITAAFAAGRHFPRNEIVPYWVAQISGALAGAFTAAALFGTSSGLSVTQPNTVGTGTAVLIETGLTAVLVITVLAVATDSRAQGALAAVAIGITVTLAGLIMGPITGASMNPARSIGPAVATGEYTSLWVYIVGPFIGGAHRCRDLRVLAWTASPRGDRPRCRGRWGSGLTRAGGRVLTATRHAQDDLGMAALHRLTADYASDTSRAHSMEHRGAMVTRSLRDPNGATSHPPPPANVPAPVGAVSSAGRAPALHAGGRRFKSVTAHPRTGKSRGCSSAG